MIDRKILEKMLKANGVERTASDEEIRSVLISAKWHHDDVDTAITVLRENTETHKTRVDSLYKIFRSDERLKPETISSLLGIDIDIPLADVATVRSQRSELSSGQMLTIGLISLAFALVLVLGAMWAMNVGLFHQGSY